MWVPVPAALAEEGPRGWPGRARVGVDIFGDVRVGWWAGCDYVVCDGFNVSRAIVGIKVEVTFAPLRVSNPEDAKRGQERRVETNQLPDTMVDLMPSYQTTQLGCKSWHIHQSNIEVLVPKSVNQTAIFNHHVKPISSSFQRKPERQSNCSYRCMLYRLRYMCTFVIQL
jgi:hypothetical protein